MLPKMVSLCGCRSGYLVLVELCGVTSILATIGLSSGSKAENAVKLRGPPHTLSGGTSRH